MGFGRILSNEAMGKIKDTFGKIDGVLLTEGLRGAMSNSANVAGTIARSSVKDAANIFYTHMGDIGMGVLRTAGRGAAYGAAIGAAYGAMDPNVSVIGGAWGGAWRGAMLTGGYGIGRSFGGAMSAARALKSLG